MQDNSEKPRQVPSSTKKGSIDLVVKKMNLVRFQNEVGYEHVGLLWEPILPTRKIVIHCHGNYGNFYQNSFLECFADTYAQFGLAFLSFNFRGHDGLAEGYFGDRLEYVGGAINPISDSVIDLAAAVRFAKGAGFSEIMLQGHSLGCERALSYTMTKDLNIPIALICPVNSKYTQEVWCRDKLGISLQEQITILGELSNNELMTGQYGSPSEDENWSYDIPIFKNNLLNIIQSDEFSLFDPQTSKVKILNSCLIILGTQDQFNLGRFKSQKDFFISRLGDGSSLIELEIEHDFKNYEKNVAKICVDWFNRQNPPDISID